jgi:hypothetical protein
MKNQDHLQNLGGGEISFRTEKLRPCAWFSPWYGSCPRMTTLTSFNSHIRVNVNTWRGGGYITAPFFRRSAINCANYWDKTKYSFR